MQNVLQFKDEMWIVILFLRCKIIRYENYIALSKLTSILTYTMVHKTEKLYASPYLYLLWYQFYFSSLLFLSVVHCLKILIPKYKKINLKYLFVYFSQDWIKNIEIKNYRQSKCMASKILIAFPILTSISGMQWFE